MHSRNQPFFHGLFFVLGFGIVFSVLGLSAGLVGRLVPGLLPGIRLAGGVLLLILGLATLGLTGWLAARLNGSQAAMARALARLLNGLNGLIYMDQRLQIPDRRRGYPTSFLTGIAFSAGWAPCLGPLLAAILLLAAELTTFGQAAALMLAYSSGLAIPFLIAAAALGRMSGLLAKLNLHARAISVVSGLFLLFTGWLLVSGRLLDVSASLIYVLGFGFGLEDLLLGGAALSFPLAFLAGALSFFSPCVLPLVPAYLGYMSGISIAGQSR